MDREETIARVLCAADGKDPDAYVEVTYRTWDAPLVVSRQWMRGWQTYRERAWRIVIALDNAENALHRET